MNREIKFRAWDKHYKKFRDIVLNNSISALNNNEINERFVLTQYSGLKDIDGVEIYEGDILYDYLGNKYIVEYKNGSFAIKYPYCDDYWSLYDFINIKNLEVSGNIFENEDLLEDR